MIILTIPDDEAERLWRLLGRSDLGATRDALACALNRCEDCGGEAHGEPDDDEAARARRLEQEGDTR
jgi:hypothetical protein